MLKTFSLIALLVISTLARYNDEALQEIIDS
jgi:hypothetical protein